MRRWRQTGHSRPSTSSANEQPPTPHLHVADHRTLASTAQPAGLCPIVSVHPLIRNPFARADLELSQFTTTDTGLETMPLAITTNELAPVSALLGTSNEVETTVPPVATPMVLGSCVRA